MNAFDLATPVFLFIFTSVIVCGILAAAAGMDEEE